MTQADAGSAQTAAPRWPQLVLLIAAAIELLNALSGVPVLFGNLSDVPGPGIGGAIIVTKIALMPFAALAALFFTSAGAYFTRSWRWRPASC